MLEKPELKSYGLLDNEVAKEIENSRHRVTRACGGGAAFGRVCKRGTGSRCSCSCGRNATDVFILEVGAC